jgi:CTP synthase (UTP-ammonia lyase)
VHNVSEIYKVPLLLKAQNVASIISTKLKMYLPKGMPNIQARQSQCVCVNGWGKRERAGESECVRVCPAIRQEREGRESV